MLISVIIPHLNQEDYLRIGLEALHAQRAHHEQDRDHRRRQRVGEVARTRSVLLGLMSDSSQSQFPARDRRATAESARRAATSWHLSMPIAGPIPVGSLRSRPPLPTDSTRIIGGDVRVGYEHPSRPTFLEPYESIYSYRNSEHIAEGFSGTGNLATLPSVVAEIGPFAGIEVAEDRDWGLRACAAGYAIRYVPEMIVFHPARKTFAELTWKWDRHIAHDYERIRPRRLGDAALAWRGRSLSPDLQLLNCGHCSSRPVSQVRGSASWHFSV